MPVMNDLICTNYLPDPDTNTEVSQGHEQHDHIGDEQNVLETLQPPVGRLHLSVAH